jgi:aminoglycoside 6'-N-acetyltransferase
MLRGVMLRGERVTLRPAVDTDLDAVHAVLSDPTVASRWVDVSRDDCAERLHDPDVEPFVVEVGDNVIGYIQFSEEDDPQYRHAGIDVAIASRWQRQGLGTDAVRALARYLVDELRHHRLVIDPAADNTAAIRCYAKVGFRPVGVMREYERGVDGTFHDGLLMEALARELR